MTFTFGAVLPTAFAYVAALMALVMYRWVRPLILGIASWYQAQASARSARRRDALRTGSARWAR